MSTATLGGHVNTIPDQQPGPRRRRRIHSDEFKASAVASCMQPGMSMAAVAMAHGVNANLLRRWVREAEIKPPAGAVSNIAAQEVQAPERKTLFVQVTCPRRRWPCRGARRRPPAALHRPPVGHVLQTRDAQCRLAAAMPPVPHRDATAHLASECRRKQALNATRRLEVVACRALVLFKRGRYPANFSYVPNDVRVAADASDRHSHGVRKPCQTQIGFSSEVGDGVLSKRRVAKHATIHDRLPLRAAVVAGATAAIPDAC